MRRDVSESSVRHHSGQPPISSSTRRRIRPMVPAKMMELRWLREGIDALKK
jgi:hypothetical protein